MAFVEVPAAAASRRRDKASVPDRAIVSAVTATSLRRSCSSYEDGRHTSNTAAGRFKNDDISTTRRTEVNYGSLVASPPKAPLSTAGSSAMSPAQAAAATSA